MSDRKSYVTYGKHTPLYPAVPVDIPGLSGVTQIAAADGSVCALANGGVKCWGNAEFGELGSGATLDQFTPADVVGLTSGVTQITGGGEDYCALLSDGTVKCWGLNMDGQLGNEPTQTTATTNSPTPVTVMNLEPALAVAFGGDNGSTEACAALITGGIKCWGAVPTSDTETTVKALVPVSIAGF